MKHFIALLFICLLVQYGYCQVAIQADSHNVFYLGMPNPISIGACDTKLSDLLVTVDNGRIEGEKGHYVISPEHTGVSNVEVWRKTAKGKVKIGECLFRAKRIPDPEVSLSGKTGGRISKSCAVQSIAPAAVQNVFPCIRNTLEAITVIIIRNQKLRIMKSIRNPIGIRFSDDSEVDYEMKHLMVGDKLIFSEILYHLPDGVARPLRPVEFTITDVEETK